jgi:hypothetical protein
MKIHRIIGWAWIGAGMLSLSAAEAVSLTAGHLRLELDGRGRITALADDRSATPNFIHPTRPTFLLQVKRYSETGFKTPTACERLGTEKGTTKLRLTYDAETAGIVGLTPRQGWFRWELLDARGREDIDQVSWGPLNTRCEGPVGEFFGVLRTDDTTLGLMSLEPNTDGARGSHVQCAFWLPWREGGSYVELVARDHTRARPYGTMRSSDPVPGLTVLGSAVAVWAAPRGRELDRIEQVVKTEGLPYPQFRGEWIKRSREILRLSIWGYFGRQGFANYLRLARDFGAGLLCGSAGMWGNWGHFEPDPQLYPHGMDDLRAMSREARRYGVGLTAYTLTDFTRPNRLPEPFISPVPDPRLEAYDPETRLLAAVGKTGARFELARTPEVTKLIAQIFNADDPNQNRGLLWLDDEFIHCLRWRETADAFVIEAGERGYLKTIPAAHAAGARARFVYFSGYRNVFPGTLALCEDIARNIGWAARAGAFSKVTFDGHESALQTGHGPYAMNRTALLVYEANADRDLVITSSRVSNYCWHLLTYLSWGEYDLHKGFRGSMLDYRLRRQGQLARSFIPHKMGQHYPNTATLEDINWLCGLACGWDAGVEFSMSPDRFRENPDREAILKAFAVWQKALLSGRLTEAQKLRLRQVDCVHTIREKPDGGFAITWQKRWRHPGVKVLPPATIKLEPQAGTCRVEPATVDLDWLHCPLVARSAALSDDLVMAGDTEARVRVFYPGPDAPGQDRQAFQCVLRVPADAPAGLRHPRITANGQTFVIPADIAPGQYVAFTADMPRVTIYTARHQIVRDVPIRHLNDLPGVPRGKPFEVTFHLPATRPDARVPARVNLYTYQPILKP